MGCANSTPAKTTVTPPKKPETLKDKATEAIKEVEEELEKCETAVCNFLTCKCCCQEAKPVLKAGEKPVAAKPKSCCECAAPSCCSLPTCDCCCGAAPAAKGKAPVTGVKAPVKPPVKAPVKPAPKK